ncbi:MAG TPA: energy transducer TonB [Rhizomicrobium sp.]|jgi:protein TonB
MLNATSRRILQITSICALSVIGASVAVASQTPPQIDLSRPHPQPPYPDSAQAYGEQGTVLVDVYVYTNGRAGKVRVSKSSGFDDLDTAAVEGVLGWRYVPATRDGDTFSDWTTVKVVFQLPQPPVPAPSN